MKTVYRVKKIDERHEKLFKHLKIYQVEPGMVMEGFYIKTSLGTFMCSYSLRKCLR